MPLPSRKFFTVTTERKFTHTTKYRVLASSRADAIKQVKRDPFILTVISEVQYPDRIPSAITRIE